MDERMHDRDRWGGRGERDDAGRQRNGERWHGGVDYGGRGGYGRFDDRARYDRDRTRAEERHGDGGLRDPANRGYGRYDYADEGYGGAYRRDRDDRWPGGYGEPGWSGPRNESRAIEYDERTEFERRGDRWRRDAYERGGREREANWGSAFDPSEARQSRPPRSFGDQAWEPQRGGERHESPRGRDRQGYPSDRDDERQWMHGRGGPDGFGRAYDDDRGRGSYDRSDYDRSDYDRGRYESGARGGGGYERGGRDRGGYERGAREWGGYERGGRGFDDEREFRGRRRESWGATDRHDDRDEAREGRMRQNPDRF